MLTFKKTIQHMELYVELANRNIVNEIHGSNSCLEIETKTAASKSKNRTELNRMSNKYLGDHSPAEGTWPVGKLINMQ